MHSTFWNLLFPHFPCGSFGFCRDSIHPASCGIGSSIIIIAGKCQRVRHFLRVVIQLCCHPTALLAWCVSFKRSFCQCIPTGIGYNGFGGIIPIGDSDICPEARHTIDVVHTTIAQVLYHRSKSNLGWICLV